MMLYRNQNTRVNYRVYYKAYHTEHNLERFLSYDPLIPLSQYA